MANVYNSQLDAFTQYHQYQDSSSSSATSTALPALGHAISGATGTAISNLCIYPLDLIITRLQVQRTLANSSSPTSKQPQKYTSVADAFDKIYNEEGGITGFYSGVLQDTSKSIADSFLFFLFYGYIRSKRLQSHHSPSKATLPALEELGVGALAGGLSKFFTTPLSNIVVRKQTHSMTASSDSKSPTISSIISDIREKKGITGLWSGYSASLILTLNPSITFFLYEFLKRVIIPRDKRDDPGARITFLLAAVSKAIASSITYPVSLAKARAQVDGSSSPVKKETVEKLSDNVKDATKNGSKKSAQEAQKHLKDVSKQARKNTIIHSILKIYKEEGIGGLYEGIGGEIIKGFLGHGLTMIVKDRVHELILSLYFMVLRFLKRSPSPKAIINDAREKVREGGENALHSLKTVGENTLQSARENGSSLASTAQNSTSTIAQSAKDVSDKVFNGAKNLGEKTNDSVPTAKEAGGKAAAMGNNVTEKTTSTTEYANKEAGHLLGNAGEQLGEKIEGLGGEIKRVGKAGNGGQE
ncbi:uncharacterized protein EAE98_010800 [Botrytis deweyae]|uniref:Peroxisomal adenine nucleotide transporter 1 n=1 Tax=Botrytis deweyae TaxID=2478750 RepID=A0ABQ7I7S5_9HELO|nr:uncharacterized protein EAE98_010800 [Botrytis deweyae]KAF7916215.1 hypothetical protein EAE98_010800 [Botrytis deweyae]